MTLLLLALAAAAPPGPPGPTVAGPALPATPWHACPPLLDATDGGLRVVGLDVQVHDRTAVVACATSDLLGEPPSRSQLTLHVATPGASGIRHALRGHQTQLAPIHDGWVVLHQGAVDDADEGTRLAHLDPKGTLTTLGRLPEIPDRLAARPDSTRDAGEVVVYAHRAQRSWTVQWGPKGLTVTEGGPREVDGVLPDGRRLVRAHGVEVGGEEIGDAPILGADRAQFDGASFAFRAYRELWWQCDGPLRHATLPKAWDSPTLIDVDSVDGGCLATFRELTDTGARTHLWRLDRRAQSVSGWPIEEEVWAVVVDGDRLCGVKGPSDLTAPMQWVCTPL